MFYPLHEEPFDYWRPTPYALAAFANMTGFSIVTDKKVGNGKDVLGTLLKNSYFTPKSKRIGTLFLAALLNRGRNFVLNRIIQQKDLIYMESPFFMSNLLLLKKNS
jgi:hypothetical protein